MDIFVGCWCMEATKENIKFTPPLPSPPLSGTVKRTLTLAKLTQWSGEGRYSRLDKLQSDLLALLHKAREERGTQSQVRVCLNSNSHNFMCAICLYMKPISIRSLYKLRAGVSQIMAGAAGWLGVGVAGKLQVLHHTDEV